MNINGPLYTGKDLLSTDYMPITEQCALILITLYLHDNLLTKSITIPML